MDSTRIFWMQILTGVYLYVLRPLGNRFAFDDLLDFDQV